MKLNHPLMYNNITADDKIQLIKFIKKTKIFTQSKKVKSFEEESSTTTLFGVFGVAKFNGEALVLALSADMNRPDLGTILKLMYLEPTQFLDSNPEKDGDA